MINVNYELNKTKQYFEKNNWSNFTNEKGVAFYKKNAELFCGDKINAFSKKNIEQPFEKSYSSFFEITKDYYKSLYTNLNVLDPINVFESYGNNSFVSTGLEVYYDYLYKNKEVDFDSTLIVQPSIRFKLNLLSNDLYGKNNKHDYSSIFFNNISIVNSSNNLDINLSRPKPNSAK